MKKIYFSLLVLAMLMVSTVSKAQVNLSELTVVNDENPYEVTLNFKQGAMYEGMAVSATLANIYDLLETSADALDQAVPGCVYTQVVASETTGEGENIQTTYSLVDAMQTPDAASGGAWYGRYEGIAFSCPKNWGAGENTFYLQEISLSDGVLTIGSTGQFPEVLVTGDTDYTYLYIVSGTKAAKVKVQVDVTLPAEIAEPVALYSQLNIVKEYTGTLEFTEGKQYEGKTLTVDMSDLAEVLGASEEAIIDNLDKIVLTRRIEQDGDSYFIGDSIFTPGSLAGDAWFGRYSVYDEGTGTETPILQNAPLPWSGNCTFYANSYKLEEGQFSLTYGQYPGTLKPGDEDFAEFYIVNGDKAAVLKVVVDVTAQAVINPDEMVKVGEITVEVSANIDNSYATKGFTIDMDAVVAALGCTTDDLEDIYAYASEGQLSDNHTESSGGFYFNEEGFIASWGSTSAFFVARTSTSLQDGKYTVGQMSGHYTDITEDKTCTAQLVFQYLTNYYVVNLAYTVKAPEEKEDDFEFKLVSTETLSVQIIPSSSDWAYGTSTIDLDYIEGRIGTTDFKLYTDKNNEGELVWSDNYTCTPAPGFWYGTTTYENEEHQVVVDNAGWGTNSFGITYADGVITWYQYPGQRSVGDQYEANIYLANEETGDYIKYILYVSYVDEVKPEGEIVGTEDVAVEISNDILTGDGYYNAYIDMSKAFEALGIEDPSLIESCSILAAKSATMFQVVSTEESIVYGYDGYVAANEDEVDALVVTVMIDENSIPYLQIDDQAGLFDDPKAEAYVRIGLEYDGKRYIHNIWLIGSGIATGINATAAKADAPAAIYSISGAKLSAKQKGLNIVRMQDGSVKKLFVK